MPVIFWCVLSAASGALAAAWLVRRYWVRRLRSSEAALAESTAQLARQEETAAEKLKTMENVYQEHNRRLCHTISHAARMPLSIMTGYALLLRKGIADPDQQRLYLLKICAQAEDLNAALTQALQADRGAVGAEVPLAERKKISLTALIRGMLDDMAYVAQVQGVTIRLVAPNEEILLPIDPIMMKKVFYNLLENSLKYMKVAGEVRITVTVPEGIGCLLIWKDNGMGLPKEEIKDIFRPRYRGSSSANTEGNGEGLTLVQHMIQQQGGTISAQSAPGQGMTLYIQF